MFGNSKLLVDNKFEELMSKGDLIHNPSDLVKGPFKVILLDITTKCNRTSKPFEQVPTLLSNFWAYNTTNNTSMVDGNVTLLKDQKNLVGSFKVYFEEDGKKTIAQIVDKIDCKSLLMSAVMKIFGHKSWKSYCTIPKGTYYFRNVDYDKAFHLWYKESELGIRLIKLEIVKGSETVFCAETRLVLAPVTPHKATHRRKKPPKSN